MDPERTQYPSQFRRHSTSSLQQASWEVMGWSRRSLLLRSTHVGLSVVAMCTKDIIPHAVHVCLRGMPGKLNLETFLIGRRLFGYSGTMRLFGVDGCNWPRFVPVVPLPFWRRAPTPGPHLRLTSCSFALILVMFLFISYSRFTGIVSCLIAVAIMVISDG